MRNQIALALVFFLVAGLGAFAFSQEGEKALRPVPEEKKAPHPVPEEKKAPHPVPEEKKALHPVPEEKKAPHPVPDAESLIKQLGDPDFALRAKAEADLLALGGKAVPALEKAAREHDDTHVRFAAQRLLHRLGQKKARGEKPLAERPLIRDMEGQFRRFEQLLKDLEERGLVLRDRVLDQDLEKLFGGDFDERIREFEEHLRKELDLGAAPGGMSAQAKGVMEQDGEGIEYDLRGDGHVSVTITREGETKSYDAESLDELEKSAPEAYEKLRPLLGGVHWLGRDGRGFGLRLRLPPFTNRLPFGEPRTGERSGGPPGGFRLGVWVGDISEPLRLHLRLSPDEGLLVEEVVPGSLAGRMGVERLDVIRTVNGAKVGSPQQIRKALAGVPEGGKVEVDLIRRGEPMKLYANR